MEKERLRAFFSGAVQGVGFRFTALNISQPYKVTGYVRNLSDGRVELIAEGERKELEEFLEAVRRRMSSYIQDVETDWEKATGEFKVFGIRH